jgi:hypothetical protein
MKNLNLILSIIILACILLFIYIQYLFIPNIIDGHIWVKAVSIVEKIIYVILGSATIISISNVIYYIIQKKDEKKRAY